MDDNQSNFREILSNKYDELEAEASAESPEAPQIPGSDLAGSSVGVAQSADNPQQAEIVESDAGRDPITGKFTKKAATPQLNQDGSVDAGPQQTPVPAQDLEVPVSWRKESSELFKKLPPSVQSEIVAKEAKREQIWNQIQMDHANFDKSYGQIAQVVAPYEKDWARAGVTPAHVINHLLTWNNDLQTDFVGTVKQMLANKNMTLEDLAEDESSPTPDPRIAQLEAKINELQGYVSNREEEQFSGYQENLNQMIDTFASEKDGAGQLAHPHFRELYEEGYLTPIAQTLREANPTRSEREILDKAYEIAAYSNPKTRAALIQSTQAKRVSEMKTRTQIAKEASSTVSGAPGVALVSNPSAGKSLRELLSEKYDEMVNGSSY